MKLEKREIVNIGGKKKLKKKIWMRPIVGAKTQVAASTRGPPAKAETTDQAAALAEQVRRWVTEELRINESAGATLLAGTDVKPTCRGAMINVWKYQKRKLKLKITCYFSQLKCF